jgi:F-type H+-transporting ATPase subunit gamma
VSRLAEIESHIGSMADLLDIVGAMRSLAGMRRQEALHALPGVRTYSSAMAAAIGDALLLAPELARPAGSGIRRRALVLYLAEHGFVGGFNERLIEAAQTTRYQALLVLGTRGAAQALERGLPPSWTAPAPTRSAGAVGTAHRLAAELYRRIARGEVDGVDMMFARCRPGGPSTIEQRSLWPVDLAALQADPGRQASLHNLKPDRLLETLLAEYVFAQLTEGAVESVVSENEIRLATMEAARDNVAKKLDALRQTERQERQAEITTELLDLVTGAEALHGQA